MIAPFQAKVIYHPDVHEPLSRQINLNPFPEFLQWNTNQIKFIGLKSKQI